MMRCSTTLACDRCYCNSSAHSVKFCHSESSRRLGEKSGFVCGGGHPSLTRQQRHSARHQQRRNPSPPVHALMQKDFRGKGVADECQRCGGGPDQAHVSPGQSEEEAEKRHGHGAYAQHKVAIAKDSCHYRPQPGAAAQQADISHLLHGVGDQDVSYHGRQRNHHNRGPRIEVLHSSAPLEAVSCSSACAGSCSVNAGPPATNPTPPVIRAIPAQRIGLTCSCSANRATSASTT